MGTTPNMGIPYPESTDAVANGATAMENLATTVDNKTGLIKIASGILSLTTSYTNVTGVFGAEFKNYRVILNVTARSTSNRFDMRYINGTTPTTASYFNGGIGGDYASNAVLYFQRSNNDANFFFDTQVNLASYVMDIHRPFAVAPTYHMGQTASSQTAYAFSFGGVNLVSASQTGFQLGTNTGTMTVDYQVFGYRN
jgi:hypothetical protein